MKYLCTGRVVPDRCEVWHDETIDFKSEDGKTVATFRCNSSQILICINEIDYVKGWRDANYFAMQIAQIAVGAVGFVYGYSYKSEMIQVASASGDEFAVIGVNAYGDALSVSPQMQIYRHTLELSKRDANFRMAVRDYLSAIGDPLDCATYCYRAMESLHYALEQSNQSIPDKDWQSSLCEVLKLSKPAIREIGRIAGLLRHGKWSARGPDTDVERLAHLKVTQSALCTYLEFRIPGATADAS